MLNPEHFVVLAGQDLVDRMAARRREMTNGGVFKLTDIQQLEASAGILGAEVVKSVYGWSVRYDSGLQNFSIIAGSREKPMDLEKAEWFARHWVSFDPEHRYAWRRKKSNDT